MNIFQEGFEGDIFTVNFKTASSSGLLLKTGGVKICNLLFS